MRHYLIGGIVVLTAIGLGAAPAGAGLLTIEQAEEAQKLLDGLK
jgi:hypothetical protein